VTKNDQILSTVVFRVSRPGGEWTSRRSKTDDAFTTSVLDSGLSSGASRLSPVLAAREVSHNRGSFFDTNDAFTSDPKALQSLR
jgi:hypothetical protein